MLDIVRYQEFLFRNGTVNKDYIFTLNGQTLIGNQAVYSLDFKPHSIYTATGYFTGTLYVVIGSLAIIRAEYELTEHGLSMLNISGYMQVCGTTLQKRVYRADYTRFDGQWSFQSGSGENSFTYNDSGVPYQARVDLVVTTRQANDVKPFNSRERADYRHLPMQSFDQTDSAFWQHENYLLPLRPLPQLIINATNP